MKFCLAITLLLLSVSVQSQNKKEIEEKINSYNRRVSTILKTNPFAIFWGSIPFTAEYRVVEEIKIGTQQSISVGISYLGKSPIVKLIEDSLVPNNKIRFYIKGIRLQYAHRFYLTKNRQAPFGKFIGIQASYSSAKASLKYYASQNRYVKATHFNINAVYGKQKILGENLSLEYYVGMGYKKNIWYTVSNPHVIKPVNKEDMGFYGTPVNFVFGINVGFGFK